MAHKFNGVDVRTPTSFNWGLKDITVGDGDTADGADFSEILTQKRTLSYSWSDPTKEETAQFLQLINQSRYVFVTYPDPMSGNYETREFKCTNKNTPFRDLRVGAFMISTLTLDFEERQGDPL